MKKLLLYTILTFFTIGNYYFLFAEDDLTKAKSLFDEKKYEDAQEVLEEILDTVENNAEIYFYLGKTLMMLNEYEDASENFEEAVNLENNNSEYHFELGRAYGADARESNFISQALLAPKIKSQFEIAVELDCSNIQARVALSQYYLHAPGIMGGDVDKTIEHGKILLKLDEPNGRIILANAYIEKEQFDLAEEQYKLLLNKFGDDKKHSGIYNAYGYMLLNRGKVDDAIEAFKKQVELAPEIANSYDSLGDGYKAAGKYKLAKESYEKALSIDPEFEASVENLEEIEELLKK
jgi:tetratricopeptide (TPR) repeat protein